MHNYVRYYINPSHETFVISFQIPEPYGTFSFISVCPLCLSARLSVTNLFCFISPSSIAILAE